MGHKQKQQRFAELGTFSNTIQLDPKFRGKWQCEHFQNNFLITLELGCGKGEYTLELAQRFPRRNFIGIDIKGDRLWRGAKTALELNLKNVAFLRIDIYNLTDYFAPHEVAEIWITFPDPYPKRRDARKRLTAPNYLDIYRQVLKTEGEIHLKTDSDCLFQYTQAILKTEHAIVQENVTDLYHSPVQNELLTIQTTYEKRHLEAGRTIKYLRFGLGMK